MILAKPSKQDLEESRGNAWVIEDILDSPRLMLISMYCETHSRWKSS